MLKIRLLRIGAKKKPFYRVVAVDERTKRNGAYIELLGTYNPLTTPKDIKLKQDRIDYWVKLGAQLSTGYLRVIGKAPQRPPRKPKKASKESDGQQVNESAKLAETPVEETAEPKPENQQVNELAQSAESVQVAESADTPITDTPAEEPTTTEEPTKAEESETTDERPS